MVMWFRVLAVLSEDPQVQVPKTHIVTHNHPTAGVTLLRHQTHSGTRHTYI